MCENKAAEVHAIRRDPFRHLFTHEVFQTPAVKISGYQKKEFAPFIMPLVLQNSDRRLNHRASGEAENCTKE